MRALLILLILTCPSLAYADAVPDSPLGCVAGSQGDSDHEGPYCRATTCAKVDECKNQASYRNRDKKFECRADVGICINKSDSKHRRVALDSCTSDSDCKGTGVTCVKAKRCVLPGLFIRSNCSCNLRPTPSSNLGWLSLPLLVLWSRRRCGRIT